MVMPPERGRTEFGETLAKLRKRRPDLSQRTLSRAANIGVAAVGQLESGARRNPKRETIMKLSAALGTTPEEHAELLQSGGHVAPGRAAEAHRPSLEVWLQGDPDLTADQRQSLLGVYTQLVRSNRGQRRSQR